MDIQFYGANCIVLSNKDLRIVIDDNLKPLGSKSVSKDGDVILFTGTHDAPEIKPRMLIDMPGEYEIGDVSISGMPARPHLAEAKTDRSATIYKVVFGELTYVVTGHLYPELSDDQLEELGIVDVLFIPVGGNGFTLDPIGALKLARHIDPKILIPTHYADAGLKYEVPQQELDVAVKELAMEPKQRVQKLKLKPVDLTETTQLVILERS